MKYTYLFILFAWFACGCGAEQKQNADLPESWDGIEKQANGTTVRLMMWQGDPFINTYMQQFVKPALMQEHQIDLQIASGQGNLIVSLLMSELEAGKKTSSIDLMWINGETFFQLREIGALFGPFTDRLPHAAFIDWQNPFIANDFQMPIDGYECPWGNVQMAMIYDSLLTPQPPTSLVELKSYLEEHPGTFTIPNDFTGMTLLKAWMMDLAGGPDQLIGEFNEDAYQTYSSMLWTYIRSIKPYMWKEGKTFPDGPATMHRLLADGELHFSMSNNDGEVDNKVLQGILPPTARAFVWDGGTIQNSHYMGIPFNSANKAGAFVVINFLLSPEAQFEKMKPAVWGDGTVLNLDSLPGTWKEKFQAIPERKYAPLRSDIYAKALPELAPEYMIRLFEDFRTEIIEH